MTHKQQKRISKLLSLVLRYQPETIGLTLNSYGWADTQELLHKINTNGFRLTLEELKAVVENNDKQRFTFSEDLTQIRANQGHSLDVDLGLAEKIPPDILFHGTAEKNLLSIRAKGLLKGQRHHVHLSSDALTAYKVGQRYGKPVILRVRSGAMCQQGLIFYQSDNGVWLTDHVDPRYIEAEEWDHSKSNKNA